MKRDDPNFDPRIEAARQRAKVRVEGKTLTLVSFQPKRQRAKVTDGTSFWYVSASALEFTNGGNK